MIRRRWKVKAGLIVVLILVALFSAAPQIYKDLFIHDEDFKIGDETFPAGELFSGLASVMVDKQLSSDFKFLNNGYVVYTLKIDRINLKGAIISGDIFVQGQVIKDSENEVIGFRGKLFSKELTLNLETFMPVRMAFTITGDKLKIKTLHFGRSYELNGTIDLKEPFDTALRFNIIRADIKDFAAMAKTKHAAVAFGSISGVVYIKGGFPNLFSNGSIQSRHGRIGPVEYNLASIRFEGFGPIVNIVDSNVRQEGRGILTMEGYIDLRKIREGNLLDGLRIKSDMMTIVWDGWDITNRGTDELRMTKDINDNMRVGLKTEKGGPFTTYDEIENSQEMSLEYSLGGLENLKMKLKDKEEFFGIEHNVRF